MMDLRELYQEIILDHNDNPRNHRVMEGASSQAQGYNPLCGDKLTVYLQVSNDTVKDISFIGCGCAISQASASLMTEAIQGKSLQEAHALFKRFHAMLTQEIDPVSQSLDKLSVLAGVRAFPVRVKCATLAWHTFEAALEKANVIVSTE